jgi:hypothetical protein
VELPCILGQGHGSKTWPNVVLQSSDQTDKAFPVLDSQKRFESGYSLETFLSELESL